MLGGLMGRRSAESRRDDIIAASAALFFEMGYEAATVNDIVERAGVSKGGFYHHFASKEDALEALSLQLACSVVESVRPILDSPALSPYERLNDMLTTMRRSRADEASALLKAFSAMFVPENFALYHRINRSILKEVAPVFAQIIAEGAEDGTFAVAGDARSTADLLLCLGTASYDTVVEAVAAMGTPQVELAASRLQKRFDAQGLAADRILGLPDGSVRFAEPGFARALLGLEPLQR